MNVLSLFDGMGCGRIALERAGIYLDNYYAFEIDKHAINVASKNYPDIKQRGDVYNWREWDLPKIDLLIGGSPCQDLSVANRNTQLGLDGPKSNLFYMFIDVYKRLKPRWFLLENVAPVGGWKKVMDTEVGSVGVKINSSLFTPQNRNRIYWTNIPYTYPEQQTYKFEFEENPDSKYRASLNILDNRERMDFVMSRQSDLCGCLTEALSRNGSSREYMSWLGWVYGKTGEVRKPTPIEAERLQTVPDNYTSGVSDTQRYKLLGNGWTVDVITHIFSALEEGGE